MRSERRGRLDKLLLWGIPIGMVLVLSVMGNDWRRRQELFVAACQSLAVGDSNRGEQLFGRHCIRCHVIGPRAIEGHDQWGWSYVKLSGALMRQGIASTQSSSPGVYIIRSCLWPDEFSRLPGWDRVMPRIDLSAQEFADIVAHISKFL